MHNNYYFLRQLSTQLNQKLVGFTIVSCFSQNKEELIIEFNNSKESFFLKASLTAAFCCLSFPESFNRARKNSVDLFNDIILTKVLAVTQYQNERSFSLELENNHSLLFKMHGNRANVVLLQAGTAVHIFRNHLTADLDILPGTLDRQIDWSQDAFIANLKQPPTLYFTFGKEVWHYLSLHSFTTLPVDAQWNLLQDTRKKLESPVYYVISDHTHLTFSLLPYGNIVREFNNPVKAVTEFFNTFTVASAFDTEKAAALKSLQEQVKGNLSYIKKTQQKLDELIHDQHYQEWADLIMAYMHEIKQGQSKVTLTSFYNGQPVEIKLKQELSPQKNAEAFYRKAKNQQIEIDKLTEAIQKKEKDNTKLNSLIKEIEDAPELKSLRKKTVGDTIQPKNSNAVSLPYHEFEYHGYKIWVGRNAESNDKLTQKYAYKDDLWLHAKDVPGSHVLIKHQSGKNYPKDVIERAAELAAYNSKRKTDTLCPVIVTQKKYVRKRKGDPAGAVVVEREDVIMVEPKL